MCGGGIRRCGNISLSYIEGPGGMWKDFISIIYIEGLGRGDVERLCCHK